MKKRVRLTESDLHKIVKESVNRILKEEKHDKRGFGLESGRHKDTGTKWDKEGFNKLGLDRQGFKRDGYGLAGWNREGFNKKGFDKEGFDKEGFNKKGIDRQGFNRQGFNREGFNREGYDNNGLKKGKQTWDSIIMEYYEKNENYILQCFKKMLNNSNNDFGRFSDIIQISKLIGKLRNQIMSEVVSPSIDDSVKKIWDGSNIIPTSSSDYPGHAKASAYYAMRNLAKNGEDFSKWVFTYGCGVGIEIAFSQNVFLQLEYNHYWLKDTKINFRQKAYTYAGNKNGTVGYTDTAGNTSKTIKTNFGTFTASLGINF